jgi:hypothetical protein
MRKDRGLRRLVPSTWEAWAAAAFIATVVFGSGGLVVHWLWPSSEHLSWRDKIDLACYVGYGDMIEASKKPPTERLRALVKAEDRWIGQMERESGEVPVAELLSYSTYLHDKREILKIRRKIAASADAKGRPSHRYATPLAGAQQAAQFDANQMGLTICGREDFALE